MAGGKMAIYSGMWEKLKATDDEIAQVMGHEIAHALADRTRERMSIAMTSAAVTSAAAVAITIAGGDERAGLALTGAQLASVVAIQLPNSRESEAEADQIGIEIAARAGFDPKAAVTLWQKMGKEAAAGRPSSCPLIHRRRTAAAPRRARRQGAAALRRGQGRQMAEGDRLITFPRK